MTPSPPSTLSRVCPYNSGTRKYHLWEAAWWEAEAQRSLQVFRRRYRLNGRGEYARRFAYALDQANQHLAEVERLLPRRQYLRRHPILMPAP